MVSYCLSNYTAEDISKNLCATLDEVIVDFEKRPCKEQNKNNVYYSKTAASLDDLFSMMTRILKYMKYQKSTLIITFVYVDMMINKRPELMNRNSIKK